MKKILNKLNSLSRALVKKLNNFRLTAVVLSIISLVAGIVSLGLLFIYNFGGGVDSKDKVQPSFVSLGSTGRLLGMVFFLFCIFVVILSVFIIYNLLPYMLNKEKLSPKKSPVVLAIVNGGLQVVVIIFSILAIVLETPTTLALYIVTIPFNVVTCVANFLCIILLRKCTFYQPAIGSKLRAKKAENVEAEAK